jgi:hypothetical protein
VSEHVRTIRIVVEVDTNKQTYRRVLQSMGEAKAFYRDIMRALGHEVDGDDD